MKKVLKIVVIIVVIFVILALTKNLILKGAIENGVSLITGLELSMKTFNLGIMDTSLRIQELRIKNPKDFEEPVMLDMPEIFIDYNLTDIITGNIHLESLIINLQQFNVVKNANGDVNLNALKVVQEGEEKKKETPKEEKPKKKGEAPQFQLDNLELALGSIAFIDYSGGKEKPSVNDFKFNINEKYHDISNPQVIIAIILQKAFLKASIAKIAGFDLGGIQGVVSGTVGNVDELASKALGSAKDLAGGALESVEKMPGTEAVSDVTEGIKDIGGKTTETAEESAKKAVSALKGLGSKFKNPLKSE